MFALGEWEAQGEFLRFTWSDDFFDDGEREHVTLAAPILACYNGVLMPLAHERGEDLSVDELLRAAGWGANGTSPETDWLGIVLYSEQRFREAMGRLSQASTPEAQAEVTAARILYYLMWDVYGRLGAAAGPQTSGGGCGGGVSAPADSPPVSR
jgi:hypothetical protein